MFWLLKQRSKIQQTFYVRFYAILGYYFHIFYSSMKYKYPKLYVRAPCYFSMEDIAAIQKYTHLHMMFAFSFLYWTILWRKVANTLCKLILVLLDNNFIIIASIYVSISVPSINFYLVYNKEFIKYMRSLHWGVVLFNFCLSAPEIDLLNSIIFKGILSMIGINESYRLCWEKWWKKLK